MRVTAYQFAAGRLTLADPDAEVVASARLAARPGLAVTMPRRSSTLRASVPSGSVSSLRDWISSSGIAAGPAEEQGRWKPTGRPKPPRRRWKSVLVRAARRSCRHPSRRLRTCPTRYCPRRRTASSSWPAWPATRSRTTPWSIDATSPGALSENRGLRQPDRGRPEQLKKHMLRTALSGDEATRAQREAIGQAEAQVCPGPREEAQGSEADSPERVRLGRSRSEPTSFLPGPSIKPIHGLSRTALLNDILAVFVAAAVVVVIATILGVVERVWKVVVMICGPMSWLQFCHRGRLSDSSEHVSDSETR